MTKPLAALQLLLLDLLSPIREVPQSVIDQLDESDWTKILAMASEHRVTPLLDWRLKHDRAQLVVPDSIRAVCADAYKAATLRSLAIQRELLLVHRLLAEGGFPHIFLKGAYLAYFAYPQPGLRSMRDIDILFPEENVLKAFHYLIEKGAERTSYSRAHPEAALAIQHHLPPLYSPSRVLGIELHFELFHNERRPEGQVDINQDQAFWERRIQRRMADETLDFVSPTDLLLHLIEHAVYGHQFNNGPLVLSDISYLLQSHDIDWPLFWQLTDEAGYTRGARLTLALVSRYYSAEKITWPDGQIPNQPIDENILIASTLLLLRDMNTRSDIQLISTAGQQRDAKSQWAFIKRRLFPSRVQLALNYPVHPKSPLIYFYYPRQWWRLLSERIPDFLQTRRQEHVTQEVDRLSILNDWLRS
jgi:hypothetical protein